MIGAFFCVLLSIAQAAYSDEPRYVRMYLFWSKDCEECVYVKEKLIPELNRKYDFRIRLRDFNIDDLQNYRLMLGMERTYGIRLKNPPPTIFIGEYVLDGGAKIRSRLEEIIRFYYLKGGCGWPKTREEDEEAVIKRFKELGLLALISGGLLDGVNPCAFTVLLFFVSYLSLIGRKGKQILLVGSAFTLAIFASYLLVGIGLFEFINRIPPKIGKIFLFLVTGGTLLIGVTNLYDYYRIRRGSFRMGCPVSFGRISNLIKRYGTTRHYVLGGFITGFGVSLLEFFCTGQIYFPLVFVLRYVPELRIHAFLYLILYNLMFILPLIVVFVLAYYGTSSEWLTMLVYKHLGKIKILTAFLFFGITGILMFFILRWFS